MAKVVIEGNTSIAGSYEVDLSYFTNRELHIIKKESGLRMGEFEDAIENGDADLLVAIALVALRRNGHDVRDAEELWEMPAGKITIDASGDEVEELPPSKPDEKNGSASPSSSDSSVSGDASPENSPPSSSGLPG